MQVILEVVHLGLRLRGMSVMEKTDIQSKNQAMAAEWPNRVITMDAGAESTEWKNDRRRDREHMSKLLRSWHH